MILTLIHNVPFIKRIYTHKSIGGKWTKGKLKNILPLLSPSDHIIDIGCGSCMATRSLREKGYPVTPLDVENLSFIKDIQPVVYDGKTMPFEDKSFDVALLLTVLHHTDNPEAILAETARVAKRIILIEDVYDSKLQERLTHIADSIVNWGYSSLTYNNKTDLQWRELFQDMELTLIEAHTHKVFGYFKQITYFLDTKN